MATQTPVKASAVQTPAKETPMKETPVKTPATATKETPAKCSPAKAEKNLFHHIFTNPKLIVILLLILAVTGVAGFFVEKKAGVKGLTFLALSTVSLAFILYQAKVTEKKQ